MVRARQSIWKASYPLKGEGYKTCGYVINFDLTNAAKVVFKYGAKSNYFNG
jgi:hypothetical protein